MNLAAASAVRRARDLLFVVSVFSSVPFVHAEGSRTLFPAGYSPNETVCDANDPCRADLDVTLDQTPATLPYMGVAARRQFLYVYAKAGELIELGSSNRANGGDIFVFNPQSFGAKGNETIPGTADFTCSAAGTYAGGTRGTIGSRAAELAGPNSADGTATVTNGYAPCAYVAPSTGIYGVRFTKATSGGGPDGLLTPIHIGNATVAAWEVQVRASAGSKTDINGRLFTYAQIAFTGSNGRPVAYTVYYSTLDGQRYQQTMTGLDPNGYALWADTTGFLDNGQPLYHDIRGNGAQVSPGTGQFLAELSAPAPQMPLFFSSIDPANADSAEVNTVLGALGIPLAPASPSVTNVAFNGLQSGNQTYVGGGGTFTFTAANDTTFQIVISRGVDFDPANPLNATLTGLAPNGNDSYVWNGLGNDGNPFPPGTFNFQITGRNGEIHFPIIDAEGNKKGGPTLTKLNGSPLGDHTVYFDDRGYKTSQGNTIGTVNGALCPAGAPDVPPTPDHSLLGVDSSVQAGGLYYRNWPDTGNNNQDCTGAAQQGFGDSKGLDLWSFQSTPTFTSTVVINPGNITLSKTGPATVKLNTPFNYTINLGNSGGGATGTSVTVKDVLPAGVIANSVAAGTGVTSVNCGALPSAAGATLTCAVTLSTPLASGAPNGTASFTINATATVAGTAVNNASTDPTGGSSPPPPGPGCTPAASCGSANTTVIAPPTISKAFGAAQIPLNGSTSLTFTITNPNAATALSGVAVTDALPAGLVVATPNGLSSTCGGTTTATAGSGSVTLSNGALAANGTCTIALNVTGTTTGTKNNTTGAITSTEGGTGTTSNTATLVVVAPPTIAKAFGAASIALNGSTSLTLSIANPNVGTALSGIAVTDNLPAGLVVATPNGLSSTCGGTVTATAGSSSVSLSGGTLAGNGNCTIALNVTGTTLGTKNNTTGAITSTEGGTGAPSNTATVVVLAPPSIAKAFSPTTIAVNGTSSLTLTITNPNAGTALAGVAVTDTFPSGLLVATPNGLASTCGGAVTATAGSNSVSLSGGAVAAGGSCTITLNVTGTTAGTLSNTTGTVSSTNAGSGNTATANLVVLSPPSIAKSFTPGTIPLNGTSSLTLTLSNPNAGTALAGVAVSDTFPLGMLVATPNGLATTCGGAVTATAGSGSVSLSGGAIAAGGSCTITLNVTGTTAGTLSNTTGTVSSTNAGTGNTATANLVVLSPPSIAKAFSPTSIPVNGTSSLTLTITNPNAGTALSGVAVSDTFPLGLIVATPNGLANTCGGTATATAGAGSMSLSGGSIAAGGTCTVTLNVTASTVSTFNNTTGNVSSTNAGTGNTGSATLTTTAIAPPTISKAFGAATILLNASTSLTFTIDNPNTGTALSGVAVSDNLPAGLVVATPSGVVNGCGGTVTATAGSGVVSLSGGTLAANANCTISLNVSGTSAGTKNNTTGPITSTESGPGSPSNTATVVVLAPPSIAKAFSPTSIPLNGTSGLTLTITNPNAGTALSGVAVTDAFPSGLLVATPNGLSSTCGGTATATAGSGSVSLSGGTIAAGGSCAITLNVTGTTAGTLTNTTGAVSSTNAGSGNTATANLAVLAPPSIAKAFTPTAIPLNGTTSLSLTIANPNAGTALSGVAVSDTFPSGLVVSTPNGLSSTCGGTTTATAGSASVSLSGGTIAAGGSCTITLNVDGTSAGSFTNTTGNVSSTNAGSGNTASANLDVIAPPSIAKAFNPTVIPVGGTSLLTLTITNPNAAVALTGVAFDDLMPSGMVGASPVNLTNSCGGTATAATLQSHVVLSNGTIAAGGTCSITLDITASGPRTFTNNTGAVTSTNGGTGNSATAVLDTVAVAPPSIAKAFTPGTIALNGTSNLTLTITNPNASTALNGVAVTDTFPSGLLVATPNGLTNTCGGTVTATAGSGSVALSGATIAASASCTISLNVTGTTAGTLVNTTGTVSSSNGGTGNSASANLDVLAPPSIAKAFNPSSIAVNGISSLTLTITNPNAGTALAGVAVSDAFPANLLVATPNNLANSCGGTVTATAGSGSVSLTGGTIAANGTCTITLDVTATAQGTLVNTTGNVSSTNAGSGNSATATLNVSAIAPPSIAKSFGAATIALNGTTSLSFTITNPNASTALNGVAVTDTLPAGLSVATPNGLSGSCGGGTITATAGSGSVSLSGATLPASASCTFQVNVIGTAAGTQNNVTGSVTSTNGGSGNTASASIAVLAPPTVVKAFAPVSIAPNGTSTLTITLGNSNGADLTGAAFTDTLPAGVTTQAASAATSCTPGTASQTSGTVGVSGATIPANGSCTVSVTVSASASGSYVNTIPAGAVTTTNGGSNTTPTTATLTVTALTPPTPVKSFSPSTIAPGGSSTLSIVLSNANASALMGVTMTDTLPSGMTVASPNALASTCGGTTTAAAGSGSVSLTGGTIAANGTCTVSVAVTAAASGNFVNTIAVGAVDTSNGGPNTTPTTATLVVTAPAAVAATPALDRRATILLALMLLLGAGYVRGKRRVR